MMQLPERTNVKAGRGSPGMMLLRMSSFSPIYRVAGHVNILAGSIQMNTEEIRIGKKAFTEN